MVRAGQTVLGNGFWYNGTLWSTAKAVSAVFLCFATARETRNGLKHLTEAT